MDLSKELVIRREQPADYAAVEQVVRDAFWNVYTPACTEHYLLHIMRDHPAFVPELDMVALVGEKIVGSVVYMRSFILACNGIRYETLTLGPIAVLPEYQRQGVGRSLISQSWEAARRTGFRSGFRLQTRDIVGIVAADRDLAAHREVAVGERHISAVHDRELAALALVHLLGAHRAAVDRHF